MSAVANWPSDGIVLLIELDDHSDKLERSSVEARRYGQLKPCSQRTNWTELNCVRELQCAHCSLQPINFVMLTRVTNNASCNWVNLVQVSSVHSVQRLWTAPLKSMCLELQLANSNLVQFSSPIFSVNTLIGIQVFKTGVQFCLVQFVCCEHGFSRPTTVQFITLWPSRIFSSWVVKTFRRSICQIDPSTPFDRTPT